MLSDDHMNVAPSTRCSFASSASTASRTVSPGATVSEGGETTTETADCITVTTTSPEAPPAVAVIVAVPLPAAVTSPDPSTVATASSLDAHEKAAMAWPLASTAMAVSRSVSPRAAMVRPPMVAPPAVTVTESVDCITVTVAVPEAPPAVAVIVAVPLPTAVTNPVELTSATAALLLAQVTAAPAIT